MIISSIDIKGGRVVQLKNGRDLVLERDDAEALIQKFNATGEVAIIDLDAAMGTGENMGMIEGLLPKASCRVGGGVRTVERARALIKAGAKKVIVGTNAFAAGKINESFLKELAAAIGRDRIIIAIDSVNGVVTSHGWQKSEGIPVVEAAGLLSAFCSELLFTCVEREGCLKGIDIEQVKKVRAATKGRLTVAGGVTTIEEVVEIGRLGCDVQLGMALYKGLIKLEDAFIECLDWRAGLLPMIAQDTDGNVLMLGYASRESLKKTFECKRLTFFSRRRQKLWTKGETSGNYLNLLQLRADCDQDTILATVEPAGPSCHLGGYSCFGSNPRAPFTIRTLEKVIAQRFLHPTPTSYTATLNRVRAGEKLLEEAGECVAAATHEDVVAEAADVMYFLLVLLHQSGVQYSEVIAELNRRHEG